MKNIVDDFLNLGASQIEKPPSKDLAELVMPDDLEQGSGGRANVHFYGEEVSFFQKFRRVFLERELESLTKELQSET